MWMGKWSSGNQDEGSGRWGEEGGIVEDEGILEIPIDSKTHIIVMLFFY